MFSARAISRFSNLVDEVVCVHQPLSVRARIQIFFEKYGETVLATPKKSGLELTIWTLPIFASIFGTMVIFRYASRKTRIPDSEVDLTILEPGPGQKKVDVSLTIEDYDLLFQEELERVKKEKK